MAGPLMARDHRHGHLVDGQVQRQCLVGEVGGEHVAGQVRAGAEHRALTGQHDRTDVLLAGVLDGFAQTFDEFAVERVAALGTLQSRWS